MGTRNSRPTSQVAPISNVGSALQYGQMGSFPAGAGELGSSNIADYGYGQGGGQSGGLLGNIGNYMDSDFMGGFSDMASGLGGLAGIYFGYEQMQDAKKNNSLYRSVMGEQQNQRSDFMNSANSAFGNSGSTSFNTSRPTNVNY